MMSHRPSLRQAAVSLRRSSVMTEVAVESGWSIGEAMTSSRSGACPEMAGSKAKAAEITKEFQRRFTERFRHLNCRELLAEKELQPTDTALELAAGDHCGLLIVSAAEILCGMIGEK